MTLPAANDIFVKISAAQERSKILNEIILSPYPILAKVPHADSELLTLKGEMFSGREMTFTLTQENTSNLPTSGEIMIKAQVGEDFYLFSTNFSRQGSSVVLPTDFELFHLQRREDYRLKLPGSYKVNFKVNRVGASNATAEIPVLDLSAGGCRLLLNKILIHLKVGDVITGELQLPDRPAVPLKAEIRHQDNEGAIVGYGLMFLELTPQVKNRLAALVMDLYRKLYSRLG